MKVSFDGPNRLMVVNPGTLELDVETDIYSDWKEWTLIGDNGKYLPAMRTVGGDPTTAGLALGATFFLINGWRIRSWEGDHRLQVAGNLYTEEGDSPYIPVLGAYTVTIESRISNLIDGLSRINELPTVDEIWNSSPGLLMQLAAKILQNKTITNPNTGQIIVFDDDGITPLLTANLFEDADGLQAYRGQGAERRERLG
jgi:hypothetical protein